MSELANGDDWTQDYGLAAEPTPNTQQTKSPVVELERMDLDGTYFRFQCPEARFKGYMIGAKRLDIHEVVEPADESGEKEDILITSIPLEFFHARRYLQLEARRRARHIFVGRTASSEATA